MIIGPDLVWRGDHWVTRPEYSKDSQVRRAAPPDFDRAVRNTYKVLLTRGMLVYSTDAETQEMLSIFARQRRPAAALGRMP